MASSAAMLCDVSSTSGCQNLGYKSVSQFYMDKCVFITGATGFMGKVLVEKLLRSCPGVRNIFLLIRSKKGQDVQSRLKELLDAPLFDKIRRERPADLQKIVPIIGDVTEPELGIGTADQALLCRQVHVVFHSAATVKFDEKLKLSVAINMLGTKRLVELCHRMTSLEALIHVSTAYCNCDRGEVDEIIYPPPYDPDRIIEMVEWMPEEMIDDYLTSKLIGKRPNTYTFTKALAEHMLLTTAKGLPVAIVRPSIVLSSKNEPMSGWVDNWNGPTGIISAVGKGFFRTIICHHDKVADLVPVDTVINLLVVSAWKTAQERKDTVTVYNCCTGQQKPIKWKDFVEICIDNMRKHPLDGCIWYPTGTLRSNKFMNQTVSFLVHSLPAFIMDIFAKIAGKRPIMGRVQFRLSKAVQCLEYFTTQQWRFSDTNVRNLSDALTAADREAFPFDVRQIDWPHYIESYVLGVRKFLFKETEEQAKKSRVHMTRLYWLHQMSKVAMFLMSWRFLYNRSKHFQTLWNNAIQMLLGLLRLIPLIV